MKTIEDIRSQKEVPVLIADQNGTVTEVNSRFTAVFGWEASEVIGQSLAIIIPKHLRDAHNLGFSRFLTTEMPTLLGRPINLRAVTKQGNEFDAEHVIVAEKIGGNWQFAATIRPLSGQ